MTKNNNFDSSVKIGDKNTFQGDTVIGEHAKIIKHVHHDNSIKYSADKIDVKNLENNSIKIINKYGEKKPLLVGFISFFAGIVTIVSGLNSIVFKDTTIFSWFPIWLTPSQQLGPYIFGLGILLAFFGGYLISLIQYKYESQCPKCKQHYALKEVGMPEIREVRAHDGIKKTTTRFYKCSFCPHFEKVPKTETIPHEEKSGSW